MIGKALDGVNGTIVFGRSTPALQGDISHTGDDDYLVVTGKPVGASYAGDYLVPLASVLYVRIDVAVGREP